MPGANEILLDRQVAHQVYLLRLDKGIQGRILALLNRAEADLKQRILERLEKIKARGTDLGPATTRRLQALLREVGELAQATHRVMRASLKEELDALAAYEAGFQERLLNEASPVILDTLSPAPESLKAIVTRQPLRGRLLRDWAAKLARDDVARLQAELRIGLVEGESTDQIVRRIFGTRALRYADGAREVTRRGTVTLVRTAVNHVSNRAREEVHKANAKLIKGERWTSTLDGRTTAICRARDGKIYLVGKGPRPPAHPNCRTTMTAVLDGEAIGNRPSVRDTRTGRRRQLDFRKEARANLRARGIKGKLDPALMKKETARVRRRFIDGNIGQVPASQTYQQWLKRQPKGFQDEVLGKSKAKLFRKGGLSLDRFVDASGQEYTLEQLRRREAAAFAQAGIGD